MWSPSLTFQKKWIPSTPLSPPPPASPPRPATLPSPARPPAPPASPPYPAALPSVASPPSLSFTKGLSARVSPTSQCLKVLFSSQPTTTQLIHNTMAQTQMNPGPPTPHSCSPDTFPESTYSEEQDKYLVVWLYFTVP